MSSEAQQSIRAHLRDERQHISSDAHYVAAHMLVHQLKSLDVYVASKSVAGYCAVNGEIDPLLCLKHALDHHKICYLPVIHSHQERSMSFCPFDEHTPLMLGPYDIPAPPYIESLSTNASGLDIVLVPLIAFDRKGNRLGCGAGYYDTFFAERSTKAAPPLLIGLAFEFQEVDSLDSQTWDIRLDMIITPSEIIIPAA